MTIDGYVIESLANGSAYVIADGVKTLHNDEAAALRHVQRLSGARAAYEAKRIVEGGKP